MTQEEKAKAYDEALDRCKEWVSGTWGHSVDDSPKDIAELIFPQLRESEDERIRKEIIDFIQWAEDRGMTRHDYHQAKRPAIWIAYLEKQKENPNSFTDGVIEVRSFQRGMEEGRRLERQKECIADSSKTSADEDESIRKFLVDYFTSYKIGNVTTKLNGYRIDDILAYLKKQKELPFVKDVVLGYPGLYFYDGERMHFRGNPAMEEKHEEPHYTKRNALFDKCAENCDPKTVEEVNKRVDDIMNMPELSAFEQALTNLIGYWEDDEERWPSKFVKKHGKHILDMAREELQKERKPAQTVDEKEYIRTIKSIISDFIRDKKPEDVAYYQRICDWLDGRHIEQKPAEWSEEDEEMLNSCISSIEEAKENRYAYKETDGDTSYDHEIAWLKSLRPSWKPSEEQMKALQCAIIFKEIRQASDDDITPLKELYEQLEKLM